MKCSRPQSHSVKKTLLKLLYEVNNTIKRLFYVHGSKSRRNPIPAGDVLHVSAAAEETQLPPVRVCETTQVAYQADAQISCTVKPSGFLVREWS